MTLKLYQKEDGLWYFSRLGKEYCLGLDLSAALSFYDSVEQSKVFHIKFGKFENRRCPSPVLAIFRFKSMYDCFPCGYIESEILSFVDDRYYLPFPEPFSTESGRFIITKIW